MKLPDARVILPALSLNNTQQKIVEAIAEYSQELLQKNANDPRVIPYALLVAQLLVEQTKMKLYVHYIFAPLVYRRIYSNKVTDATPEVAKGCFTIFTAIV